MNTVHLWQALKDGTQIEDASLGTITLHQRNLGELVVSTGQVVACDPLVYPDTKPFQVTLPPGRYPVFASVASFTRNNDRRIAYALLQLGTQQPVRWGLARLSGQDINSLQEGQFFGYMVDAGIACFMDIDAAAGLQRRFDANRGYMESLIEDFLSHEDLNVALNPFTGANAIMFASGWGDGFYASYWGYDAGDNTVCLVTDFALFSHPALKGDGPSLKRRRRLVDKLFHIWQHRGRPTAGTDVLSKYAFGQGYEESNGKARAKVVSIESSRSRTGSASYYGQTLDQSRTYSGSTSRSGSPHSSFGNRKDRGDPRRAVHRVVWPGEWAWAKG